MPLQTLNGLVLCVSKAFPAATNASKSMHVFCLSTVPYAIVYGRDWQLSYDSHRSKCVSEHEEDDQYRFETPLD